MNALLPLLLTVGLSGASTSSYPIDPCPLRQLCDEAELIVHARVRSVTDGQGQGSRSSSSLAALDVLAVLKGTPQHESLAIAFNPNMFCPAPARYEADTSVIAFLEWDLSTSTYQTKCLSYGIKTLDEAGCQAYVDAVREYFVIQSSSADEKIKNELLLGWSVRLAANPITRWDGAIVMAPPVEIEWKQSVPNPNFDFGRLTLEHIRTLRDALFETEDLLSHGTPSLIRIVRELGDPDLAEFLVEFLEASLGKAAFDRHYELNEIMYSAARAANNRDAHMIVEEYSRLLLKIDLSKSKSSTLKRKSTYRTMLASFIVAMRDEH